MKPQSGTKRKTDNVMLRARVTSGLKNRLGQYAASIDRSEAYVLRKIVTEFLSEAEQKKAA